VGVFNTSATTRKQNHSRLPPSSLDAYTTVQTILVTSFFFPNHHLVHYLCEFVEMLPSLAMILFVWYINNNQLYENSITTQIYLFLLSDPLQLLISNHNNVRLVPMLQTAPDTIDTIDRVTLFLSLYLDHCRSSHVIIKQSFQFLSSNSLGYSNEYTKITLLN
jgi:hypothetical protein